MTKDLEKYCDYAYWVSVLPLAVPAAHHTDPPCEQCTSPVFSIEGFEGVFLFDRVHKGKATIAKIETSYGCVPRAFCRSNGRDGGKMK